MSAWPTWDACSNPIVKSGFCKEHVKSLTKKKPIFFPAVFDHDYQVWRDEAIEFFKNLGEHPPTLPGAVKHFKPLTQNPKKDYTINTRSFFGALYHKRL